MFISKSKAWFRIVLPALLAAALCPGCGYRIRSAVGELPAEARSIGIPTFRNVTSQFKIEQLLSRAVLAEFSARTRAPVNSSSSGVDLVLLGEILSVNSVPVTFNTEAGGAQTFGSAFLTTVRVSAKLLRAQDGSIVWQNDNFTYIERYVLNSSVGEFFSEENPALERLARSFAASLASSILERSGP